MPLHGAELANRRAESEVCDVMPPAPAAAASAAPAASPGVSLPTAGISHRDRGITPRDAPRAPKPLQTRTLSQPAVSPSHTPTQARTSPGPGRPRPGRASAIRGRMARRTAGGWSARAGFGGDPGAPAQPGRSVTAGGASGPRRGRPGARGGPGACGGAGAWRGSRRGAPGARSSARPRRAGAETATARA